MRTTPRLVAIASGPNIAIVSATPGAIRPGAPIPALRLPSRGAGSATPMRLRARKEAPVDMTEAPHFLVTKLAVLTHAAASATLRNDELNTEIAALRDR